MIDHEKRIGKSSTGGFPLTTYRFTNLKTWPTGVVTIESFCNQPPDFLTLAVSAAIDIDVISLKCTEATDFKCIMKN
jgi:hypothetical protein